MSTELRSSQASDGATPARGATLQERTRARHRVLVQDALRVISADPGQPIALDDVASDIATSRRSLQRAFEVEGITFRQALAVARIRRARDLLGEGSLPVHVVADRVGYQSKAEFTKAFKRHTGELPSVYRRAARERRKWEMERQSLVPLVRHRRPQYDAA